MTLYFFPGESCDLHWLGFDLGDLAQHSCSVSVQESNSGKSFAVLEVVNNEGLEGFEHNLGHLVGFQDRRSLLLLSTSFFSHLPVDANQFAGSAAASNKSDWSISDLDFLGDIKSLDLAGEVLDGEKGGVFLVDHDVTGSWHVGGLQVLNIETNIVTGSSLGHTLVVHLHGKHLSFAWHTGGVGGEEVDELLRQHLSLFDTSCKHVSDTLNLVQTGNWKAHRLAGFSLWFLNHLFEAVHKSLDHDLLSAGGLDLGSLPPIHFGGFIDKVVTDPSRDWHHWHTCVNERLLPANLLEHQLHLVGDLVIAVLSVLGDVAIHFVNSNNQLFDSQKVDQTGVLAGLSLDLSSFVVSLLDSGGEVTISRHHQQSNIGLSSSGNHVLDEVTMSRCINDGVVVGFSEEFFGVASNGHTTVTLLLLGVHVEGKGKGSFSSFFGFLRELGHGSLINSSQLEDQVSGGGTLS